MNGFLVINKPVGITSRDALDRIQGNLPRHTKLGHTGTLDPFATGTLVVCLGQATRLASIIQGMPKLYITRFRLGATTNTDDVTGEQTPHPNPKAPTILTVELALQAFRGPITQRPPAFSAVRVAGKRAHELARRGVPLELSPRSVHIYDLDLLAYRWPTLDLRIRCSKGTYIRSLARDLGELLGVGAYAETLHREAVGPFLASTGLTMDSTRLEVLAALQPMRRAVEDWPTQSVTKDEYLALTNGRRIAAKADGHRVALLLDDELVAISEQQSGLLQPRMVFPRD
ncbi:MAG: tRNA pseudouridine(55) synthase TruB [Fimbriiglobus sp.]